MKLWPFSLFERKTLSNPTAEEYALFTGGASSGTISAATALTVPAAASCVRLISEAAASLDIFVEREVGGKWERDDSHPVAKLLADQPNDWSSTFELVRDLVAGALTNDKGALGFVNRVANEVREVVAYQPANFTVDYSADGRLEPTFRINNVLQTPSDVVFIRSPFSRCPLSLASDALATAKAMETHAKKLFENGARPSGLVTSPKPLGDEGAKKMITGFKAAFLGVDNAAKVPILWDGTTFQPLTLASTDSQFLENRIFEILEVCRHFRVPPSMIFELTRATWSNSEQMGKEFLTFCLEAWLKLLESAMRRALFTSDERAAYRIRFDRDDLTRADLTARATAINSLRASEVLSADEGRDWLDLPPRADGKGDSYENPNITVNTAKPVPPVKVAA